MTTKGELIPLPARPRRAAALERLAQVRPASPPVSTAALTQAAASIGRELIEPIRSAAMRGNGAELEVELNHVGADGAATRVVARLHVEGGK